MTKRLRILSLGVMTYMLAALCWWAILLYRKNNEIFKLESKLLQEKYINDLGIPTIDVTTLPEFEAIRDNYDSQMAMIMGETAVFGIILILGLYFINRAFSKELAIAEKQKNFLLSITHELKSPLASINLILDTFIKRELPAAKVKELSTDALQESTRLNELFNKILLATRLDTAYQYVMQEIDISTMLNQEVDRIRKLYPATQVTADIAADVRVGSEDTRTAKGTGLGLYIVKQIIVDHKGKIKIADGKLGGAAFEIIL